MVDLQTFANKLLKEKSVALFCHIRPDGDSVGSAVALRLALESKGIKATVFCEDLLPERFFFLKGVCDIKNSFEGEFSALVAVDCADVTRLGVFATEFEKSKNTFSIDHHISNTRFAKVNYVAETASNAENVYQLINCMKVEISEDIANLLATGIITDTGNFKHKNVTAQTFLVASKLLEKGADVNKITYYMFTRQTANRAKLFGLVMSKIRYFYDGRFAVATVSKAQIAEANAKEDETEGFIDFVMGVKGVCVGACVMEMEQNKYKISLRSRGESNVNAVAGAFGGGGHILASGCRISGEYEEVIDRLCFEVSKELKD
ncbi:MAG: bifunctional oligoribonuclease/PAP phosphatase NrnA [Clostridia bacterium]|nr:bifunctional oligoribonuclease/PAP phosphatase NrnA [Clostridia bacterium]